MSWDGKERRRDPHWEMLPECKSIFRRFERLEMWALGIIFAIVVQIVCVAVTWGELRTQVKNNSDRMLVIESLHPRVATIIPR